MAGRTKGDAQPGRTWNRHFNHPYTARKTPPTPVVPIVGCDQTAPWALFQAAFGTANGYRGYNTATIGVPTSWPGPAVTFPPGLPAAGQIVSFRPNVAQTLAGTLDSAIAAFFATVPAGAFCTAWHEAAFVGNPNPAITPSDLIALHTRLYGLFQANAPAAASYGQIEAITSAFSGHTGFPLGQWMCTPANGGALLDFYGMDVAPQTATSTYAGDVGTAIAAMVAAGVPQSGPWTICETGYHPIWAPQQQAAWYSDGWNVAQAIGAIHYLPFFSPTAPNAYQLWPAPSTDTLRVLQDAAAIARGDPRSPPAAVIARDTQAPLAASASTTSLTATFSSNPTAGSKVLVAVQASASAALTLTDNGTTPATFVLDASCLNSSGSIPSVWLYRADNITLPGAGTYAVTVNLSPSGKLQAAACAYTGVQNGPPSSTSAVGGTGANPAGNPVTPNDAASLFFSAFFCDSVNSPESITVASPEFTLQQVQTGSGGFPGAVADALTTTPAPRAGGWTLPDSPDWSAVMAAYGAVPVKIAIVPGPEMVWAQTPVPATRVSANAGTAAATGAAGAIYPGTDAGLASASGWAAVNAPITTTVNAGLATASGAALFTPSGSTVSVTLTAINPVGAVGTATGIVQGHSVGLAPAAGAALNATVITSPIAGTAGATGVAGPDFYPAVYLPFYAGPSATVSVTAGLAPATAAAQVPGKTVTVTAGLAAATGAALAPAATVGAAPGIAAATGAALQPAVTLTVTAALAAATGAALNATATTAGSAPAGLAAATGTALAPATAESVFPAAAASTGAALAPVAQVAGTPAAAAAAGTGQQPAVTVTVTAGLAAATGTAVQPTVVTGVAPNAGLPTATGAALQPGATVTPAAGLAASTGAALQPTVVTGITPNAGLASASAAALQPAVTITVTAVTAPATGAALPAAGVPTKLAPAGLPTATGTAPAPSLVLTALAQAAAAQALARALDATGQGVAAFTVGTLTAFTAPGGAGGTLTATDTRTGGPS